MKSMRTIRRHKAALRYLVDNHPDVVVQRIAYAMEQALVWAAYPDVKGWPAPAKLAELLKAKPPTLSQQLATRGFARRRVQLPDDD